MERDNHYDKKQVVNNRHLIDKQLISAVKNM